MIAQRHVCGVLPMSDHVCPFMGSLVLVIIIASVHATASVHAGGSAAFNGGASGDVDAGSRGDRRPPSPLPARRSRRIPVIRNRSLSRHIEPRSPMYIRIGARTGLS